MRHIKPHDQSLIILLLGSLLMVWFALQIVTGNIEKGKPQAPVNQQNKTLTSQDWLQFESEDISFKYPTNWEVLPKEKSGKFELIQIKNPNDGVIKIYTSSKEFFALEGVQTEPLMIDGNEGVKVSDTLVAVKKNDTYYTFDLGLNTNLIPEFKLFLQSVRLK